MPDILNKIKIQNPTTGSFDEYSIGNTVDEMTGASAIRPGEKGLVPAPAMGDQDKFLKGDGTWADTPGAVTSVNTKTGAVVLDADDVGAIKSTLKGTANGVAELDSTGKLVSSQLPGAVGMVYEAANRASFPTTGDQNTMYIALDTNKVYRWGGTVYVEISEGVVIGTTANSAHRGDHGTAAYNHAQAKGAAFTEGLYKFATNAEGHVTTAEAVTKSDLTSLGIQDQIQYTTMPTAGSTFVDKIVQYTGTTTSDYINGHFYKCKNDSGTYSWVELPGGLENVIDGPNHSVSEGCVKDTTLISGMTYTANVVTGTFSHAEGFETSATNDGSHAEGFRALSSGHAAHAEGYQTKASNEQAHAEGLSTSATERASHAEGEQSIANGLRSHAEGYRTTANGSGTHTEGKQTLALNEASHAEGISTTAASGSHAEGVQTSATGDFAHAEGRSTTASGEHTHSEGMFTLASNKESHAEGYKTTASGYYSHVGGYNTIAQGYGQTVIGQYNIGQGYSSYKNDTDYAFIIGNGQAPQEEGDDPVRSNAFGVKWNGNINLSNGADLDPDNLINEMVTTMPTASEVYSGKTMHYVGATDSNYTSGNFYKCINSGGTYRWVRTLTEYQRIWKGTNDEWDALSTSEKIKYDLCITTDDLPGKGTSTFIIAG